MNDFEYDSLQKKRLAQNARHRVNGSKSKRCSLPSDNLTESQKRALNGPVTSVKLNEPMSWEEFKPLSDSLKREYLNYLFTAYGPSTKALGEMFGCHPTGVGKEMHRLGAKTHPLKYRMTKERKAMWSAFCNGVVGGGSGSDEESEAEEQEQETETGMAELTAGDEQHYEKSVEFLENATEDWKDFAPDIEAGDVEGLCETTSVSYECKGFPTNDIIRLLESVVAGKNIHCKIQIEVMG